MPKISVLMPVYNGEKYIGQAIRSVLNQTYRNFEIIIVDDNSQDRSPQIIQSFDDSRIKYFINEKNLGLTGNWNRCVNLGTAPYQTMLHQDDVMRKDNLQKKINCIETKGYRWVASDCYQIDSENKIIHNNWFRHHIAMSVKNKSRQTKFDKMFFVSNYFCFTTIMWERKLIEEIGLFTDKAGYCTDVNMWLKFMAKTDCYYIPEQLIFYRWAQNLSLKYDDYDWLYDDCLARKVVLDELGLSLAYRLKFIALFGAMFLKYSILCFLDRKPNKVIKMLGGIFMLFHKPRNP